VDASERDLIAGSARRSPSRSPEHRGSNPLTSTRVLALDRIGHADAARLGSGPQLQVLYLVVVLQAVAVMHVLLGVEVSPQMYLHDQDVLEDVGVRAGTWMLRREEHQVAGLVTDPTPFPCAVG